MSDNDARTAREERVRALVKRYAELMGLDRWDIDVKFTERCSERASCKADAKYQEATLNFKLAAIDDDELERFVRHELFHAMLAPYSEVAELVASGDRAKYELMLHAEETVATMFEKMPVWEQPDA